MKLMWYILWLVVGSVGLYGLVPVVCAVVCGVGQCLLSRCWHPFDLVLPAGTGMALRLTTYCCGHVPGTGLFDPALCQSWTRGAFFGTMAGWAVGYVLSWIRQREAANGCAAAE